MKEYSNKLPTELPLSEFLRFYGRRLKIFFAVTLANFALIGLASANYLCDSITSRPKILGVAC